MPKKKHGIYIIEHRDWNTKQVWANGHLVMTYRRQPKQLRFRSPMVNDANQDLCGGWHVHDWDFDENAEIVQRVMAGLKPFGVAHALDAAEAARLQRAARARGFDTKVFDHWQPGQRNLAVAQPATLRELFDLDALLADYIANNVAHPDALRDEFATYADHRLIDFAETYDDAPMWVTGLVLGYPVENTISLYRQ